MHVRPTRAEIDLDRLAHNASVVRRIAGRAKLAAVVKADAYGHGLETIAARLVEVGVDGFAVALAEEGLALRAIGVKQPILVMNGVYDGAHREVVRHGLTPVVYDLGDVARFCEQAEPGRPVSVHLKVDTGMGRLGVRADELERFADALVRPELSVEGLMTHLASAEDDPEATRAQLAELARTKALLAARGVTPSITHAANTAATLGHPEARFDLVRVGLALYGARPVAHDPIDLRPVMRVVSSVARVASIGVGETVGYGRTWTARRPSRVATLAIGYGDGLMRHLSDRGEVLIRGHRCPIVGRVSMDLTGVDVTDLPVCERGDEAVIIGAQGDDEIRPEEVAARAGTIAYEVMTSIAPRVPRVSVGG
ncbi:MAG: alanine racemase [Sandaracinaceae bacterium]